MLEGYEHVRAYCQNCKLVSYIRLGLGPNELIATRIQAITGMGIASPAGMNTPFAYLLLN